LDIATTHLGLRPAERRRQVRRLLAVLETSRADVKILLGDLNEWFFWGRPLRWLERSFDPARAPVTYPAWRPWLALDRLWVAPPSALERMYAHDTRLSRRASDHLPLVGQLDLADLDSSVLAS
jgi:endonuclease/exonuclease/phosphatase family metal-dependent hydrolase